MQGRFGLRLFRLVDPCIVALCAGIQMKLGNEGNMDQPFDADWFGSSLWGGDL